MLGLEQQFHSQCILGVGVIFEHISLIQVLSPKHIKCSLKSFAQKVVLWADNFNNNLKQKMYEMLFFEATMPYTVYFKGCSDLLVVFYDANL